MLVHTVCAHASTGVEEEKMIQKTGWQMSRGEHDVCQNRSPEENAESRVVLCPCLDIAAVALYISFCRQSALVAEAECVHQSRIISL